MFIGMSFCLPIGWAFDYMQQPKQTNKQQSEAEPLLPHDHALDLSQNCRAVLAQAQHHFLEHCLHSYSPCFIFLLRDFIVASIQCGVCHHGYVLQEPEHLSNGEDSPKHSSLRNTLLLAIPTLFDLCATVLMSIGLLFVTASVYQVRTAA